MVMTAPALMKHKLNPSNQEIQHSVGQIDSQYGSISNQTLRWQICYAGSGLKPLNLLYDMLILKDRWLKG